MLVESDEVQKQEEAKDET